MKRTGIISVLLGVILLVSTSCASRVPQQEYDRVKNELSAIQSELASIRGKLVETEALQANNEVLKKQHDAARSEIETLQAKYEELSTEYEDSSKQFDAVNSQLEIMQAKYEELSTESEELNEQFQELSEQYDIIMEGTAEIDEEDVEQAVFELVNEERVEKGLNEREWGENLYKWARANSRNMATNKQLEYTEYVGWQDVFWATGYGTADRIANAALTIWKNHPHYERSFLNAGDHYCAVAVYKLGEIFYITYVADYYH